MKIQKCKMYIVFEKAITLEEQEYEGRVDLMSPGGVRVDLMSPGGVRVDLMSLREVVTNMRTIIVISTISAT
jgi:hypothetical protein